MFRTFVTSPPRWDKEDADVATTLEPTIRLDKAINAITRINICRCGGEVDVAAGDLFGKR